MYSDLLLVTSAVLGLASALPPTRTINRGPARVRRDPNATVNAPLAVTKINDKDGIGGGTDHYKAYSGNGTPSQGWPAIKDWVSFGDMFNNNMHNFFISCQQFNVPNDSAAEVANLRAAIEQIAQVSKLDHRVILAIILNESAGCVRVPTTVAPGTNIFNPGLMQDHQGKNSCNFGSNPNNPVKPGATGVLSPCPSPTILGMVKDGSQGTASGDGMASLVNLALQRGATGAQAFYYAANFYNGGSNSVQVGGNLSQYAINFANRLTGWLNDGK